MSIIPDYIQQVSRKLVVSTSDGNVEDIDISRKSTLLHLISVVGIVTLVIMGTISFLNGYYDIFILDSIVTLILFSTSIFLKRTKKYEIAAIITVSSIGALTLYNFITGGDNDSGYLWSFTYPLFCFFLLGSKKGKYGAIIFFTPLFIYLIINPVFPDLIVYPKNFSIKMIGALIVITVFTYLMEVTRENSHKKLLDKNIKLNSAVNELQKTEEKLREAGERLESRVEERTKQLVKVNNDLLKEIEERKQAEADRERMESHLLRVQKMEAVGTLAGGVAHDLNNILAGIVGYPDLILMDLDENSPIRKPVLTIKKSGEKAAAIVDDLLTLSRRNVSVKEIILIEDVIQDYLESPEYERLTAFHPGVELTTRLNNSSVTIEGSPVHISKTIMNLVSNAAEAMPDGGKIIISTETIDITDSSREHIGLNNGRYIKLEISDTGEGISDTDIKRIFEPFFSKKVMGRSGTGLGMAVVWGTVKDHDGIIDVKSELGKGTTFTIYFPASAEIKRPVSKQELYSIHKHLSGKGESILIVDDLEEQREVASDMLKMLGYKTESVSDGEKAVEYLKSSSADLVLLDMIMSTGMDGLDTYEVIKKFKPDQKIIITSGYSETDRVRECIAMGACSYIKKPFNLEKIGMAVKEALT